MKKATILIVISAFSCNSQRDIDKEMRDKLTEFYTIAEAKDYKPISYSELDTIKNIVKGDGSLIRLTGTLIHTFSARSNNGNLNQYTDTIDVTIFDDVVIALPRGYE